MSNLRQLGVAAELCIGMTTAAVVSAMSLPQPIMAQTIGSPAGSVPARKARRPFDRLKGTCQIDVPQELTSLTRNNCWPIPFRNSAFFAFRTLLLMASDYWRMSPRQLSRSLNCR